ncbi:hypothetical protein ABZ545_19810 [Streptomyces abikoensis]|uniref:hypothetical protein n=1 Tax=Streptomyces abikoensis TaxID=97398 RepID=UPI0033F55621
MNRPPTSSSRSAPRRALLACAAVLALGAVGAARPPADPGRQQCGDPHSTEFPITSRIAGGPAGYERGGTPRTWRLELRNATGTECRAIHPVAVLADRGRALEPADFHLDFQDPGDGRWLPVRFERTDEAENVGVLDGGSPAPGGEAPAFPGFTVPAHGSVTVPLRLGFAGDAPEGPVTVNVTAVQKRGGDGAWVGESGDYTFAVGAAGADGGAATPSAAASPSRPDAAAHLEPPGLADTGDERPVFAVGAAALALLIAGTALVVGARRLNR